MSDSFDLDAPDLFTAGAIGEPGHRVFYIQAHQAGTIITLKCEKEHVRALGEYLSGLLGELGAVSGAPARDLALREPITPAWEVGAIAVGYDQSRDRIVIEATEITEETDEAEEVDEEEAAEAVAEPDPIEPTVEAEAKESEGATARFLVTREQAAAFVGRADDLVKAGRPVCPMCSQPKDPGGHVCPRSNGHFSGRV